VIDRTVQRAQSDR